MRDATKEERESVYRYIKSISVKTGIYFLTKRISKMTDIEQIKNNSFFEGYKQATEQANGCIKQIRAEIEQKLNEIDDFSNILSQWRHGYKCGLNEALEVIDEYAEDIQK